MKFFPENVEKYGLRNIIGKSNAQIVHSRHSGPFPSDWRHCETSVRQMGRRSNLKFSKYSSVPQLWRGAYSEGVSNSTKRPKFAQDSEVV